MFVRIRAGIDVTMGEAIWEFLTIDPETGIRMHVVCMYVLLSFNYYMGSSAPQ